MADLSITAANVVPGSGVGFQEAGAGEVISAGQLVALDTDLNDGKLYLCDADLANRAKPVGIAVGNAEAVDQRVTYARSGEVAVGGTVAVGGLYVASDTPGGIAPNADLDTGDLVSLVAVGKTTTSLEIHIVSTGIAAA